MNILLISQCDKRALTETRRILDQFAERRGDRTWQTPITETGLNTLRKLLRKTARKNTAVACHWIRGRDHSELLWVVGNAGRFNAEGAVPTNTTKRNVLRREDENDWHSAEDIRLLAQLAALLHDLGKASVAFQERLQSKRTEKNLYRHEWVSLRLFMAFIGDDDDTGWLARLTDADAFDEAAWIAKGRYLRDGVDAGIDRYPFIALTQRAPIAAAVAWLIVSHHRVPVIPVDNKDGTQAWLGKRSNRFEQAWLETPLSGLAHDWNEIRRHITREQAEPYWMPAGPLPVIEPKWRAAAARVSRRLLVLRERRQGDGDWLQNAYVMHLARMSLMLADHYYSSLHAVSPLRVQGDGKTALFANTDRDGNLKQPLDEHLLGVTRDVGLIAHALPGFERHLPRLSRHRGLRKRSADARFSWQDKAFDTATGLREAAAKHGAFVVNMASTGCGKTLANARILYALSDPQLGLRATYALGLRTLTLQTGRSYRHDLHLGEDELAVLVGGSASRALFEFYEQKAEARGSASVQSLIEEDSHVFYEGNVVDHPLLARALADADIRKLLSAPMLVCTVDHLVPATESLRAGRQIAPMLRLMSADLVLDELDDYDLNDLPALTRLVHWAGLLGTRVVLSSATLPPALVEGMFMAYRAGRRQFRRNRGEDGARTDVLFDVPCLWTDEFGVQVRSCADDTVFSESHRGFVDKRVVRLAQAEPLRRAELWPLEMSRGLSKDAIRSRFAESVREACLRLHEAHAEPDPVSGKRVSFGIVRMANIDPIVDVASALYRLGAPEGMRIHLCVYHARFPLAQRSAIEAMLDATLNRRKPEEVWRLPAIRAALDAHPEHAHAFVVLASPVCEVGRDWDADWALAEPSSMRSLIQLAGRVQRHRRKPPQHANVLVFEFNLKHCENGGADAPAFVRPGFEKSGVDHLHRFRLGTHRLSKLMAPDEYQSLSAIPRIRPAPPSEWNIKQRWIDLEQARMTASMLPRTHIPPDLAPPADMAIERDEAAIAWQHPQAALIGVLPQQQPFRDDTERRTTLVFLPDDDEDEGLQLHRVEDNPVKRGESLHVGARELLYRIPLQPAAGIASWGGMDLSELLALLEEHADALGLELTETARRLAVLEVPRSDQGWRWHPWLGFTRRH